MGVENEYNGFECLCRGFGQVAGGERTFGNSVTLTGRYSLVKYCWGGVQAQMAVVAEDCDQPDIKKLVEALCNEHGVQLLSVPESKQLGQWAGVRAQPSS